MLELAPPPRQRMPNPIRSARTREKLMRATVECLYELGYDRTSTVLVTKRAGVSRGAMLHQFPSKADLMIAVSDYIRLQRRAAHEAALEGIEDPLEQLRRTVDITWSELSKPSGVARIEIMLASRSDKAFGARFAELNADLDRRHKKWMWRLAQEAGVRDQGAIEAMTTLYTAALRGLAIDLLQPNARPAVMAAVALLRDYQNRRLDELITAARRGS
ncbi:MAG TPA: TetR/AcrR family transcriptional regulator [Caulobacteraceae bacterium]|nr:TetR/AcrR family transcriptional regulator [Caulobacteraceae bacterium]